MTAQEKEALSRMTEEEIRRAQDLVVAQVQLATSQGNSPALMQLWEWQEDYADELMRRLAR